jgi:hypothetical protein
MLRAEALRRTGTVLRAKLNAPPKLQRRRAVFAKQTGGSAAERSPFKRGQVGSTPTRSTSSLIYRPVARRSARRPLTPQGAGSITARSASFAKVAQR